MSIRWPFNIFYFDVLGMQRTPEQNMNHFIREPHCRFNIIFRVAIYDKMMPELFPLPSAHPRIGETNDLDLAHLDLSAMELLAALRELCDPLVGPYSEDKQALCLPSWDLGYLL